MSAHPQTIVLAIEPAPKPGRLLGYVGDELIVTSRQPFLDGARELRHAIAISTLRTGSMIRTVCGSPATIGRSPHLAIRAAMIRERHN